ncbi:MAG: M50 family metallopeptidase [Chlamydiia bacterium]|nr:M50 family metallopeptidase [Chlamydiia bacterium]
MLTIPGRIPITIHPFFWLFAAFIGWIYTASFMGIVVWVGIIFFSVLIHEFGHALTALFFGQKPQIQLVALGGVTSYEGKNLRFWQQFLITFNGPLFGFFLFLFASLLLQCNLSAWPTVQGILKATQMANLFWTIVNLLPVIPLDGGQLLRIVLEASFGLKGFKASLLIGAIVAALIAFYFLIQSAFLVGAIFFLFAFQSFDSWRKSRYASRSDRDEANRELMIAGETALREGRKAEAKRDFEEVRHRVSEGLLFVAASQYLAFLDEQEGKHKEAYDLLLPIKGHLSGDFLCLLHKLASNQKNYLLVAEIASDSYQASPTVETAVRNARAFAYLRQPEPSGGWLQTALQQGHVDLENLLREETFAAVKNDSEFRKFIDPLP